MRTNSHINFQIRSIWDTSVCMGKALTSLNWPQESILIASVKNEMLFSAAYDLERRWNHMYYRSFPLFIYCLYVKIDLEDWRKADSALANFCSGYEMFGRSQVHDLGLEDTETFTSLRSNTKYLYSCLGNSVLWDKFLPSAWLLWLPIRVSFVVPWIPFNSFTLRKFQVYLK